MATLRILFLAAAAVVLAASFADPAAAQADCTSSLAPCLPYLNATGTAAPATCCNPLKTAVATQKACLCNLFNTPGLLQSLNVNSTQVVDLAKSCGVNADPTTLCSTATGAPSPTSVGTTTPAVATAAPPPPPPGNGATPGRIGFGLGSLVLVFVTLTLHY